MAVPSFLLLESFSRGCRDIEKIPKAKRLASTKTVNCILLAAAAFDVIAPIIALILGLLGSNLVIAMSPSAAFALTAVGVLAWPVNILITSVILTCSLCIPMALSTVKKKGLRNHKSDYIEFSKIARR